MQLKKVMSNFVSTIERFLVPVPEQVLGEKKVEGVFIALDNVEFNYIMQIKETSNSFHILVQVKRKIDELPSPWNGEIKRELYHRKVRKNQDMEWNTIAEKIIEKMKKARKCKCCPSILRYENNEKYCSVCRYSYNFHEKCNICQDRCGRMFMLPCCNHRLHAACFFLKKKQTYCPICKEGFDF